MADVKEGWSRLEFGVRGEDRNKWHYFVDKKSLCGRYALINGHSVEERNDDSPDNCAACKKKLKLRKEKES